MAEPKHELAPCPDGTFGPWAGADCRDGFDFTLLFEETILAVPADVLFLAAAAALVQRRFGESIKVDANRISRVHGFCKLGTASCLIVQRLVLVALWADLASGDTRKITRASVPTAVISFLTSTVYLFISWQEHVKTVRPSFEVEMYLFFSTILNLARARTLWFLHRDNTIAIPAVFIVSLIFQAAGLALESWEKRRALREPFSRWAAESLGGTFNKSFFVWLNPLLLAGSRSLLTLDDLPPLDVKLEAETLEQEFHRAWVNVPDKSAAGALLSTWICAHVKFVLAGLIPKLCQIAFVFTQPLLVERAIAFAATPSTPEYNRIGYGLIGAYAIVYTGIAVSTGQHQWRMTRATAYMRSALVPCITRKTLRIDLAQTSSASALTLISTDIETIDSGIMVIHDLWGSLVEIGIGAFLLWRQIGPAMGIPLGVVFFVLILAMCMAVPLGTRLAAWIKASEQRVAATSRTLTNVKSYRVAGLNRIAFDAIDKLRIHELNVSRTFRLWLGAATILPLCLPSLSPALSFAGFIGLSGPGGLSVSQALTSLSVLALLNRPLANFSISLPAIAGAVASFDRMQNYFNIPEKEDKRIWAEAQRSDAETEPIRAAEEPQAAAGTGESERESSLSNPKEKTFSEPQPLPEGTAIAVSATLTWPESETNFLEVRQLHIPSARVTVLLGPTGCGKTTLLNIILGELTSFEGTVQAASLDMSYCAQKTWLPQGSIRDAIVGRLDYDEEWYSRTIDACSLSKDFAALPVGDESSLGNKITSLSGGQKQRIAIARALYARSPICILDDAFKGLDNTTSEAVMNNLLGPHGLLRGGNFTSIISSSERSSIRYADHVVTMDQAGVVTTEGPPDASELAAMAQTPLTQRKNKPILPSEQEKAHDQVESTSVEAQPELPQQNDQSAINELDITRQTGDTAVHKYYLKAAGVKTTFVFLASLILIAFSDAFSQIWLLWWTQDIERNPTSSPTGKWLGVYATLGLLGVIANIIAAWEIFIVVITKTGLYFHSTLVQTVSRAPMSFFNTVDQGVTVNRFSQDMQLIDMELPASALGAAVALASVVGQAVIVGVTGRYIAVSFPFIIFVFYLIQKFYLRTSRQMRFLDIEHKAPLYSQTIETLEGLASIRAFGFERGVMDAMCRSLDNSQRPVYLLACLQQWLQLTSDMTVAVLAFMLIVITTTLRAEIGVGFMGLALSNVVAFGSTVQMLLVTWVQLEISIGAVARVKTFSSSIDQETVEVPTTADALTEEEWPSNGQVSFHNVSAAYQGTGRVLHDVNLQIPPGCKIGVCGRTGSGKSSLALTLFKLIDLAEGAVLVDGRDIATVPHDTLRDAIVGVPQDFLTLDSTLRQNIDPKATSSDQEIVAILEALHLWNAFQSRGGLDLVVREHSLSFGELQLLAFARAMCRKSKVLVVDEVTSSMDETNSAIVDELIHTWFKEWTIIAVAHKLESILRFDKVVILDAGRVVEFGNPVQLLQDPSSLFKKLYEGC